jgi:hypothetical protein
MSMTMKRGLALLLLILMIGALVVSQTGGGGGAGRAGRRDGGAAATATAEGDSAAPGRRTAGAGRVPGRPGGGGTAADGPGRALHSPGARTAIPRPPRLPGEPDGGAALRRPVVSRVDQLVDKTGDPDTEANRERMAQVMAGLDLVEEDVEECLARWGEVDPGVAGTVHLRFNIDPAGLHDVWLEDYTEVPAGPLSCFASAVYSVDWSSMTEKPIDISVPFDYDPADAAGSGKLRDGGVRDGT